MQTKLDPEDGPSAVSLLKEVGASGYHSDPIANVLLGSVMQQAWALWKFCAVYVSRL